MTSDDYIILHLHSDWLQRWAPTRAALGDLFTPLPRGVLGACVHNPDPRRDLTLDSIPQGHRPFSFVAERESRIPLDGIRDVHYVAQPKLLPRYSRPPRRCRVSDLVTDQTLHGSPELAISSGRETPEDPGKAATHDLEPHEKRALHPVRRCPPARIACNET